MAISRRPACGAGRAIVYQQSSISLFALIARFRLLILDDDALLGCTQSPFPQASHYCYSVTHLHKNPFVLR